MTSEIGMGKQYNKNISNLAPLSSVSANPAGPALGVSDPGQEHLWKIYDAITDMVCVVDRDFRLIMYNKAVSLKHGKDLDNKKCYEVFHRRNEPCPECGVKKTLETAKPARVFNSLNRLEIFTYPVVNERGEITAVIEHCKDAAERIEMEQSLRESEERFRILFESAPDAVFIADSATGMIIDANSAAGALLLMPREQIIGLHHSEIHPPRFREKAEEMFSRHRSTENHGNSTLQSEWIVLRSDGTEAPVEISDRLIKLKDRKAVYSTFRDITKNKNAEEFIRNVLETVDEGFIVIDRNFQILSANKAYCSQAGMGQEQIIGRKCHEVSHNSLRPCFYDNHPCAVKRCFETGEPHVEIHVHKSRTGESLYVETKSFPFRDSAGNVTAAIEIINNISEKKKLEEQLLHSQKMEAIGLLAGGIAHDFNNILSAIIGYTSLIQAKVSEHAQLSNYAGEVLSAANRAANLTHSLLAFSRKQIIDPKPLSLNSVIAKIEKLLLRVIGEDIEFKTSYTESDLTVLADHGQIEQLLLNLATNARDAMPAGGKLKIETARFCMGDAFLRQRHYGKQGNYAVIQTSDTGTGMDEPTRDRIFEPFFTTKESGKGTGLGLSIVYGIVKQNNGYIDCVSEPGKGTTFTVYLPLIEASSKEDAAGITLSARRGSETILIAEDDESLRKLARSVLERHGYRVLVAADGNEAVSLFSEHKNEIKLLVLDVVMPKKNGKETYEEIRKVSPAIKVLFTSGYTADVVSTRGIIELGRFFIAKPASPTALLLKVREVLDSDA